MDAGAKLCAVLRDNGFCRLSPAVQSCCHAMSAEAMLETAADCLRPLASQRRPQPRGWLPWLMLWCQYGRIRWRF